MKLELTLYILGLFPGWCFSIFYLKGIKEFSKNENLKLISLHSFCAIIFTVVVSIVCLTLSILIDFKLKSFNPHVITSDKMVLIILLITYFFLFLLAFILGQMLKEKQFLYKYIRPESHWNKILLIDKKDNEIFFTTVVVEIGGKSFLYVGILDDYLTNDGELEYIQLIKPYRRLISDNEQLNGSKEPFIKRFYKIDVEVLIIKYIDIKSFGLKTLIITPIEKSE